VRAQHQAAAHGRTAAAAAADEHAGVDREPVVERVRPRRLDARDEEAAAPAGARAIDAGPDPPFAADIEQFGQSCHPHALAAGKVDVFSAEAHACVERSQRCGAGRGVGGERALRACRARLQSEGAGEGDRSGAGKRAGGRGRRRREQAHGEQGGRGKRKARS
jgi:hypothetical protein